MKEYKYECFGETLEKAESLGWKDTEKNWSPRIADAIEEDAIEFIESKGYTVTYEG